MNTLNETLRIIKNYKQVLNKKLETETDSDKIKEYKDKLIVLVKEETELLEQLKC